MKKLYTLIATVLITGVISAQTTFLNKNFEDASVTSGGWTIQTTVGTNNWYAGSLSSGTINFAKISNFNSANTPTNSNTQSWYISPSIDLTNATTATLNFDNVKRFAGNDLEVFISTNFNGTSLPSTATWTALSPILDTDIAAWTFVNSGNVDLTTYVSNTVYVAFKYTGTTTDGSTIELDNIIISGTAPSVTAVATSTSATCGNTDGTATVTATGGTTPYTYLWNNAATTSVITGLAQGTYNVTVTESGGATATTNTVINNSNGPSITVTATGETTTGANDGTVGSSVSGGTAPYTYLWTNTATTTTISGLAPNTYTTTVTDNGGCTATASATVNAAAPASNLTSIFSIQNTTITNGDSPLNGTLVITRGVVTGIVVNGTSSGIGSFFIQDGAGAWNGIYVFENGTPVNIGDSVEVAGTVSEFKLSSATLPQAVTELGSVTNITILSSNNALPMPTVISTINANKEEYEGVLIRVLNATYSNNPGQFGLWDLNDGSGVIQADDDIFPYANTGVVGTAYDVTGIGQYGFDAYKILPRDINDIVLAGTPSALVANASATTATCGNSDGSATATVSGGVTPYTYLWDNAAITAVINGVSQGTYNVTITDANSVTATASATVNNANGPVISLSTTDASGAATNDGAITAVVTGGATPYTYIWGNSATTSSLVGLNPNTYNLTVTDSNSCNATASATVNDASVNSNLTKIYDIQFTTAPNGDSPISQSIITTRGVVTGVILSTFSATGAFFIQDGVGPWNGLYIFESGTAVAIGDSVEVTGKVDEFNGTTELVSVSNITILSSGNTLPAPHWLASTNDGNKEENEGVLLLAPNATYVANGANFVVILNDGSGDLIATDDIFQMKNVASIATSYDVVGIGHYAFGAYRILPRDANDIKIPTSVNELSSKTTIEMYPNPASTTFTVELNNKAVVRLLDMKGALVSSKNSSNNRVTFDVSNLNAGIYLVEVSSNNTVSHTKLIVR